MKRALICLSLLAASPASHAQSGEGAGADRARSSYANPSAAIAAELAFAQLAQEKGQWTAFRETAADDGVMFVPQMVRAQDWLKDRPNPPVAVRWQPHAVWSSCDGSLMVSHGAWQGPDSAGWFTTIWQRQKKGGYRWVLDHGDTLAEPLAAPEMIAAQIADCPPRQAASAGVKAESAKPRRRVGKVAPLPLDPAGRKGQSDDGTLRWDVSVTPDGARNLSVEWRRNGAVEQLLIEQVGAPAAG